MNKVVHFLINILPVALNFVFVALAIIAISFLFPKKTTFNFQYEVGKEWIYDDLNSPIAFPVYKTKAQINLEKKELLKTLRPFYFRDTLIENDNLIKAKIAIGNAINDSILILKPAEIDDLLQNLAITYNNGIIQKPQNASLEDIINLLNENVSEKRRISEFYTIKSAIEEVVSKEMKSRSVLLNLFNPFIQPNIIFDKITTDKQKENIIANVKLIEGGYQFGEQIITKGELVSSEKFQVLKSFEKTFTENTKTQVKPFITKIGYVLISILLFSIYLAYIQYLRPQILQNPREILFLLFVIVGILALAFFSLTLNLQSIYLVPFSVVPIIVRLFFGNKIAFLTVIITMFFTAFIMPFGTEYIFINFVVCFFALLVNINAFYWSRFFIASFLIVIMYIIAFYSVELIKQGDLNKLNFNEIRWLIVNGVLTLLIYPLVPIFEKIFGFVSNISLLELSNVNSPILKKMQTEAPGSFAHSLQVGNLAEAAATEIGANPLLVKIGALYHDIGKINGPLNFIENQNTAYNPHENYEPEESAKIIIDHVIDGIEMAKKQRLPDVIIDFIRTHHGTHRVEYFWRKYLEKSAEVDLDLVDDSKFRYPGPLPYSRETAILMLADTVEAASRSIKNPTSEDIEELVERLTKDKIEKEQFANADISFKEITKIKKVFSKMLKSIYHVRVAYPED